MNRDRYTKVAITLHWVIAAMIIVQLGSGIIMGFEAVQNFMGIPKFSVFTMYQFHKSLGLTILVLSVLRLVWRLMHKPPAYPADLKKWEVISAKLSHVFFYIFMIGIPFTGWLLVSTSSRGLPTIWFNQFAWPNLPLGNLQNKESINEISETLHIYMAYSLLALLFIHVGAALKHHIIDRNEVLHRMIPFIKPRHSKMPLALLLLAFFAIPAQGAPWTIKPETSAISFAGENAGQKFNGKFETWTAAIDFDPAKLETSGVKVEIETASAKTGTMTYDSALPQKEWFDVKAAPKAIFESKSFKSLGGDQYEATGTLTIKNIPHDITFPFTLTTKEKTANMKADFTINRLDYEIGKDADATGEWVSKDIAMTINVTADQK